MSQQQQRTQSNQQSMQPKANGKFKAEVLGPEVVPQAKRRLFSAKYKLRILAEADQCQGAGQVGALLRREGLYSSHLSRWRRMRAEGELGTQKRGRKPNRQVEQVAQLRQENERLRSQLEQAELIIDVQKKLSQLLGLMSETEKGGRQ